MITESKRTIVQVMAWLVLAAGMMLLLNDAHSSGESLESFKLVFSSNAETLIGTAIVFFAAIALVGLYFNDIMKILKHR
ncbi:MAG: hypothetical protein PHP42_13895 [Bacteroidota bacterium]|nr:hypothetical protein [Bacteroidota bacterium]